MSLTPSRAALVLGLLAGLASVPAAPEAGRAQDSPGTVAVTIDTPGPGAPVEAPVHQARITGNALAESKGPQNFDVIIAIDVSNSTRAASGVDVDGDGVVGVNPQNELLPPGAFGDVLSTDPDDSILNAQIKAARTLVDSLDPRRVQVGLVTFAGEVDPLTGRRKRLDQQDAWLESPLTTDYDAIRQKLVGVLARGTSGATNFAAGIRLAITELAGLPGAKSHPRPGAKRVILFLTDGVPTLPVGRGIDEDPGDIEAAIRAARLAHQAGISINTYALGPAALQYPKVVTEMARVTNGVYTPVQNPGDIITLLGGVSFANVEDVVFTNLTTGDLSTDVRLNPDGSFTGYVPVREGHNKVRVIALASDGTRGTAEFEFDFKFEKAGARDRLAELERIRKQNRALELQRMDMEIQAFRKEQRKKLEIEVQRPDGKGPGGGSEGHQ